MAVDFSSPAENAILDLVESTAGASPVLRVFSSAAPAATTDPDPSGLLVELALPADWMESASTEVKVIKNGPWLGTASAGGTALSWRLKTAGGVTVMQGSVSALGGGGDIQLVTTTIGANQKVKIGTFTLRVPNPLAPLLLTLSVTQAGQTMIGSAAVITPAPSGPKGVWQQLATLFPGGGNLDQVNMTVDTTRDCAYSVTWQAGMWKVNLGTGVWSYVGTFVPEIATPSATNPGTHNRTVTYDPLNDRMWYTNGTGGGVIPGESLSYWQLSGSVGPAEWPNNPQPSYEAAVFYDSTGQRLVAWGGWPGSGLPVMTMGLNPVAANFTYATVGGTMPVGDAQYDRYTSWKSVHDSTRNRWITVDDYPTPGTLYILPQNISAWSTAATLPDAVSGEYPSPYCVWVYDPTGDQMLGWSGTALLNGAEVAAGISPIGEQRCTWRLKLAQVPLRWERLARASAGDTVPPGATFVDQMVVWDASRGRMLLNLSGGWNGWTTWVYYPPAASTATVNVTQAPNTLVASAYRPGAAPPPITGTIQRIPLPPRKTSGQLGTGSQATGYAGLQFSVGSANKHTAQSYNPLTNRIYIQGGDASNPAQSDSSLDMTWSMDVATGQWRFETGRAIDGYFCPSGLQDGHTIAWMPSRQKFVLFPGSFVSPYYLPNAEGHWFYDPNTPGTTPSGYPAAVGTYEKYTNLFSGYGTNNNSTGMQQGGVYDEVNDHIVAVMDSSGSPALLRWSLSAGVRLPDVPLPTSLWSMPVGYPVVYFKQSRIVLVGRLIYIVGYYSNGETGIPALWSINIDTFVVSALAPPPLVTQSDNRETRLCASNGKIVFPVVYDGANGTLLDLLVYDPGVNLWFRETQTLGISVNSVCTLYGDPEGRAGLCGGGNMSDYILIKY